MQSKVRNKLSYIGDGKIYFEKWVSLGKAGNVSKVALWAGNELGKKNPKTGRPPTPMGIWQKMWRWCLRNPEEGRSLYASYVLELDGDLLKDEEWNSLLHARAKILLTKAGYRKYLAKYPHLEKYK